MGYVYNNSLERRTPLKAKTAMKRTQLKRVPGTARKAANVFGLKPKRETPAEKKFKREVREHDNYTCQYPGCGRYSKSIDVHHKAKRSQRPDLKLTVSNGICLCREHHDWTDHHHDKAVSMAMTEHPLRIEIEEDGPATQEGWSKDCPIKPDAGDAYYFVRRADRDEVVVMGFSMGQGWLNGVSCDASEMRSHLFLGPLRPEDTEQLFALREAAEAIRERHKAKAIRRNFDDCGCDDCEQLRSALNTGGSK